MAYYGFRFVNTGKSKELQVLDISVTGKAQLGKKAVMKTMLGYNYIIPKTLNLDYVFAEDYSFGTNSEFSYTTTSVDPSNNILNDFAFH
ncbi:MAG: hypothetical protein R2764_16780 [Bacteroidales bacterium]